MRNPVKSKKTVWATRNRTITLCGFLLLLTATASAQELPVLRISLEEAQRRTIAESHRLAEARAREAAAQGAIAVRQAADRPIVAFGTGFTRTNHVIEFIVPSPAGVPRVLYPDVPDNYRTRLDLQWPIYNGGRSDALERAAAAEASAAAADVEVTTADLRLEVARAFWALVTARATVDVLDQAVKRAESHVGDVRQRLTTGLVPPNEVSTAEAQESRQQMLLIEARNRRDMTSAELARLIGANLLQPIEPDTGLEVAPPAAGTLDALVTKARATRVERRALQSRVDAARFRVDAALGGTRPTVSLTGGFDYARPNPRIFPRAARWDDSWDAGITVAWSLWDGGRSQAEAAQAASVVTAVEQRLAEFDSLVALEVHQRLLEIDSGRAAVTAATNAVWAASEARRVVNERYQVGVITQTDVLDAEIAQLQSQLDLTSALAGLRYAEARLTRAMGR